VLRGLSQSLGHFCTIVIAIHHGYIRADEAKRFSIDREPAIARLDKSGPAAVRPSRNRE
jgi:hypothetical protein